MDKLHLQDTYHLLQPSVDLNVELLGRLIPAYIHPIDVDNGHMLGVTMDDSVKLTFSRKASF